MDNQDIHHTEDDGTQIQGEPVCSLHTTNQVEHFIPDYALIDVFRQIMPRNAEHASFNPFPVRD